MKNIFNFKNYQIFLKEIFNSSHHGEKQNFAKFIGCSPSFLTRILNREAHLSLEQAEMASQFWKMSEIEKEYFLNLVQFNRAGTISLKNYYEKKLKALTEENLKIKNRINHLEQKTHSLSLTDQAIYYSSWTYGAIHAIVSLPHVNTVEDIAKRLGLTKKRTREIISFLVDRELIVERNKKFEVNKRQLHLDNDSPFVAIHHKNWRSKTIQQLECHHEKNMHYSSIITCSEEDYFKIKDELVKTVMNIRKIVKDSQDEKLYHYALDCYEIKEL